jgi:hypothetical protein
MEGRQMINQDLVKDTEKALNFCNEVSQKILSQLHHNHFENVPRGIQKATDPLAEHAIESGVVSAIGDYMEWDIDRTIKFCADLLDNVNAHDLADKVRNL